MKIDKTPPLPRFNGEAPKVAGRPAGPDAAADSAAASPAAVTHLNQSISDSSQDIDAVRVAELKEAIRDGRLQINADIIADKLIASAQALIQDEKVQDERVRDGTVQGETSRDRT